jgi:hypothetical protein
VPENEHPVPIFAADELVISSWRCSVLIGSGEGVAEAVGVDAGCGTGDARHTNFFPDFTQVNFFPLLVAL